MDPEKSRGWDSDEDTANCKDGSVANVIFKDCDVDNKGKVAVSKLIEFMRMQASDSSDNLMLCELEVMLDPLRCDVEVSEETFGCVMQSWATRVRESVGDDAAALLNMSNLSSYSCGGNDSLNTSIGGEMIRLQELVKELKHTIKRQQELNKDLQTQLRVSEDSNMTLQQNYEAMHAKLVWLKTCTRDMGQLQRECEELRDATTSLEVTKSQLKARVRQLEREAIVQKQKLSHVESQKVELSTELDVRKADLEVVVRKMLELKLELEELENQCRSQENDKHKMQENILELEEKLTDLTVSFKQLQDEKKALEAQLSSAVDDLLSMPSHHVVRKWTESIESDDEMYESACSFLLHSDVHSSSIHAEIRAVMDNSQVEQNMLGFGSRPLFEEVGTQNDGGSIHSIHLPSMTIPTEFSMTKDVCSVAQQTEVEKTENILCSVAIQTEVGKSEGVCSVGQQTEVQKTENMAIQTEVGKSEGVCSVCQQTEVDGGENISSVSLQTETVKTENILCSVAIQTEVEKTENMAIQTEVGKSGGVCSVGQQTEVQKTESMAIQTEVVKSEDVCSVLLQTEVGSNENVYPVSIQTETVRTENILCSVAIQTEDGRTMGLQTVMTQTEYFNLVTSQADFRRQCVTTQTENDVLLSVSMQSSVGRKAAEPLRTARTFQKAADSTIPDDFSWSEYQPSPALLRWVRETELILIRRKTNLQARPGGMERTHTDDMPVQLKRSSSVSGLPSGPSKQEDGSCSSMSSETSSSSGLAQVQEVFPSLPDMVLQQLGLARPTSDVLSEQDVEARFGALSLAFKTDKLTLVSRHDRQQRLRDQAERNMSMEVTRLKAAVNSLNYLCKDSESIDILNKIQEQVDVLQRSTDHVSSAAEIYGAVQQESRVSRAIEVMLLHVENLKRMYEKEHGELQETRRVLVENNIVLDPAIETPIRPKRYNSLVFPTTSINKGRRASIAAFARPGSIDSTKTPSNSPLTFGEVKGNVRTAPHSRRTSLSPASGMPEGLAPGWDRTDRLDRAEVVGGSMEDIKELSERRRSSLAELERKMKEKNNNSCEGPEHLSNSSAQLGEDEGDHEKVPSLSESDTDCADTLHILRDSGSDLINRTFVAVMDSILPLNVDYVLYQMRRCATVLLLVGALWSLVSTFMPASANSRNCVPFTWITPEEVIRPYVRVRRYGPPPT